MAAELGIHIHGTPGEIDAGKVLVGLRHVLDLLKGLEDAAADGRPGRSSWRFTALALNSVDTGIAVLEPRPGFSEDDHAAVLKLAVEGLAQAEGNPEIPSRWNRSVVDAARKAAETLGSVTDRGATFTMTRDGHPVTQADVTVRCAQNINAAISPRRRSFGSIIGTLEAVTVHDRREAGLWTELRHHRVAVKFAPELLESVSVALGKRVEASGTVWRDYLGVPVKLELRKIAVLPSRPHAPALTGLLGVWVSDAS